MIWFGLARFGYGLRRAGVVKGGQLDLHKVGLVRGSDTESGWFRRRSGEVGINIGEHIAWQGLRVRRG